MAALCLASDKALPVKTATICFLYSALALTSEMGFASLDASKAAFSIIRDERTLPLSIFSAFLARIGVGATAPRAILAELQTLPFIVTMTPTPTADISTFPRAEIH